MSSVLGMKPTYEEEPVYKRDCDGDWINVNSGKIDCDGDVLRVERDDFDDFHYRGGYVRR